MTEGQPIDSHVVTDKDPVVNKYFRVAIKTGASDLHLKAGQPPKLRISGALRSTNSAELSEKEVQDMVFEILSDAQKQFFMEKGALDFAWQVTAIDRFRVNVFRQRGSIRLVGRHITSTIPAFKTLHMPEIVERISETHDGLVLVTGPTGCGKSTTIASMIDYVNTNRACHIVTVEDPLEFLHNDKKAVVSQREVGIDVPSFEEALRSMMRQDPDVVLVGEIRDMHTLQAAMKAAETGHLVFGTLHSVSASQTVQRILDMYPQEERHLARQTFALCMRAIISQTLLPGIRPDAKRVPAVEILINNSTVRKLIAEEREGDIPAIIRNCASEGMQDFTESLRLLVETEYVDLKVALSCAPNKEELRMALKGIRASSGGII